VAPPRPRPAEPPPSTIYVSFVGETDHAAALELAGAAAPLFAGMAREGAPTAALRVR
jgi:hypothetical protein